MIFPHLSLVTIFSILVIKKYLAFFFLFGKKRLTEILCVFRNDTLRDLSPRSLTQNTKFTIKKKPPQKTKNRKTNNNQKRNVPAKNQPAKPYTSKRDLEACCCPQAPINKLKKQEEAGVLHTVPVCSSSGRAERIFPGWEISLETEQEATWDLSGSHSLELALKSFSLLSP